MQYAFSIAIFDTMRCIVPSLHNLHYKIALSRVAGGRVMSHRRHSSGSSGHSGQWPYDGGVRGQGGMAAAACCMQCRVRVQAITPHSGGMAFNNYYMMVPVIRAHHLCI